MVDLEGVTTKRRQDRILFWKSRNSTNSLVLSSTAEEPRSPKAHAHLVSLFRDRGDDRSFIDLPSGLSGRHEEASHEGSPEAAPKRRHH